MVSQVLVVKFNFCPLGHVTVVLRQVLLIVSQAVALGHVSHLLVSGFHFGVAEGHFSQARVSEFQLGVSGGHSPTCPEGLIVSH